VVSSSFRLPRAALSIRTRCLSAGGISTFSRQLDSPQRYLHEMTPVTFSPSVARRFHDGPREKHRAFIALGSNLGDRVDMIEKACRAMETKGETDSDIRIVRTSSLWQTTAMYVLDQGDFLNAICEVSFETTSLRFVSQSSSLCRSLQITVLLISLLPTGKLLRLPQTMRSSTQTDFQIP
jgi:hypothetical protein